MFHIPLHYAKYYYYFGQQTYLTPKYNIDLTNAKLEVIWNGKNGNGGTACFEDGKETSSGDIGTLT